MYDIAILVFAAVSAIFGFIAVLPLFGFDLRIIGRPKVPLEQIESRTRPTRKAWAALLIAIMSMGLSAGAFYYFFHPRIVEKTVEKTVASPCPEQKRPAIAPIPNGEPLKHRGHAETNTITAHAPTSQSCPNGICIGGENSGTATVNNYGPPEATLTAHWTPGTLQHDGLLYKETITVNTDRSTTGPQLVIACDAPCTYMSMNLGLYGMVGTNRQVDDRTVEVGMGQEFTPDQTFTIILTAQSPFNVTAVRKK